MVTGATTSGRRPRRHRVLVPAVVAVLLAAAPAGWAPAAAAGQGGSPAPEVPCPRTTVTPAPDRPTPPPPPEPGPGVRSIGGPALETAGLVVPPDAPRVPAGITAESWLVADLDTGEVLGACGPHEYHPPASTLKLLLAAAFLAELDPTEKVRVTAADLDFEPGSSAVGLLEGGRYTVETLWLGLLLNSGNDAANVLARLGGGVGGVSAGVRAMNLEARRLGAYQTYAATPSGLDGPGQFTSAYDLALIARACFALEEFQRYATVERTRVPAQPPRDPDGFEIQNQNRLVGAYPGALGGKTGFTNLARHSYVGAAERDGRRLVVTLLAAEATPLRGWEQGAALLDWGFDVPAGEPVGRLVEPGEEHGLGVAVPESEAAEEAEGDAVDPAVAARPRAGQVADAGSAGASVRVVVAVTAVAALVLLGLASHSWPRRRGWGR